MLPIISIVGRKNSGKTGVVEALCRELRGRGLRVATMKHCEGGFALDREGADSARHRQAGAAAVALLGPGEFAILGHATDISALRLAAFLAGGADVVVAEGFGRETWPKIEVVRQETGEKPRFAADRLMAVISDVAADFGVAKFGFDEIGQVADLIVARIVASRGEVSLIVDGREVPLNRFTDKFVASTVRGMVGALREVPGQPEEIRLAIGGKAAARLDTGGAKG